MSKYFSANETISKTNQGHRSASMEQLLANEHDMRQMANAELEHLLAKQRRQQEAQHGKIRDIFAGKWFFFHFWVSI